jgi:hypothetical protein
MGVARTMIDNGLWLIGIRTIVPSRPVHDAIVDLSDPRRRWSLIKRCDVPLV